MLACFASVSLFAQGESVSKQINQIKRDAAFLYAEATEETAEKALDAARTMLLPQVQEYLESNQKTVTVNEAIKRSIYAKTSFLEMMRGSQHRVFVYVKKSDIDAICGPGPDTVPPPPPPKPDLPAWQMNAISDLLECGDVNGVRAKLNRMKVEYKIKKFGVPDNCPSPNDAFWVIFARDGSVYTILGPGTKERVSFRDMTTSVLDNYKGMNALWFNFAK